MRQLIPGILAVLLAGSCVPRHSPELPRSDQPLSAWRAVPPLKREDTSLDRMGDQSDAVQWQCAHVSNLRWSVAVEDGVVVARDESTYRGSETEDRLALGKGNVLVGWNQGEWGGGVYWWSADGKRTLISEENHLGFERAGNRVLGFSGIAHLTTDVGHLLEFEPDKWGSWKATELADLHSEPQAWTRLNESEFLVITHSQALRVTVDGDVRVIHEGHWEHMYPSSIAIHDDVVYLGMRYAVTRLEPGEDGYNETWLLPPGCERMKVIDVFKCACISSSDPRLDTDR